MRRQGIAFLVLGVVAAAAAAIIAVQGVRSFNETASVAVAVRAIGPYKQVTADDVQIKDVPAISVPPDAVRRADKVVGRFTRDAILPGDIIRAARLADAQGDRGLLSAQLTELKDPSLRAFALPYDASSGVSGAVQPGDRVDIIASVRIDAGGGLSVGVGKIVASNVLVLKTGADSTGKGTIIVALRPDQIEDIAFALTSGQLRFALAPYTADPAASQTSGVTGRTWLEKYGFLNGQPAPAAPQRGR